MRISALRLIAVSNVGMDICRCGVRDLVMNVLATRMPNEPSDRVRISTNDCRLAIDDAWWFFLPSETSFLTLGLAVIDPEGLQMGIETVRRLSTGVRLDLVIVFMSSYVKRFIEHPSFKGPVGSWIDGSTVEQLMLRKSRGEHLACGEILDALQSQLNSIGYQFGNTLTRTVNSQRSTMYHIVFASKHQRGTEFFEKVTARQWNGQKRLPLVG